jgi:Galactocerebrosidase, C-terminal lectin domain
MANPASTFFVMVAVMAALTTSATAAEQANVVRFSSVTPDSLPEGFSTELTGKGKPGQWSVNQDPSAPGGRVLAQTSADTVDYRFPLAVYQGVTLANLNVTVRFKAVSGKVDRAGGIAVRLLDNNNYYVLRANALEDNVNLYRVVKGVRREIHGVSNRVSAGEWHTLGLSAEGGRLTASFDGKQLFTIQDNTFSGAGKVALWTKADSVTQFADLAIRPLP